jgi:hypothetical protein
MQRNIKSTIYHQEAAVVELQRSATAMLSSALLAFLELKAQSLRRHIAVIPHLHAEEALSFEV